MTNEELKAVASNLVIEIMTALSTSEDGSDTVDRLCRVAGGLRTAADQYVDGDAKDFLLAVADTVEPT